MQSEVLGAYICALRRYVKFDTFHPAVEKGLPVTRVISRVVLQQILAEACTRVAGEGVILNDCRVVDYEETVCPSDMCHLHQQCSAVWYQKFGCQRDKQVRHCVQTCVLHR